MTACSASMGRGRPARFWRAAGWDGQQYAAAGDGVEGPAELILTPRKAGLRRRIRMRATSMKSSAGAMKRGTSSTVPSRRTSAGSDAAGSGCGCGLGPGQTSDWTAAVRRQPRMRESNSPNGVQTPQQIFEQLQQLQQAQPQAQTGESTVSLQHLEDRENRDALWDWR